MSEETKIDKILNKIKENMNEENKHTIIKELDFLLQDLANSEM